MMTESKPRLNEMMDRPIVESRVLDFMRHRQARFAAPLDALEREANERRVPIIPHETAVFLDFFLGVVAPKEILEIGTAIGYSASVMTYGHSERHVDTIDRYDVMIEEARETFETLELTDQVTQLEGDAADILPTLEKQYDFIFMDSAKQKYFSFFPYCMDALKVGGTLMVDDIFQAGTVFAPKEEIPRRVKNIHKKLNWLLDTVIEHPHLSVTTLPLGDGVLLVRRLDDYDFHADFDEEKMKAQTN